MNAYWFWVTVCTHCYNYCTTFLRRFFDSSHKKTHLFWAYTTQICVCAVYVCVREELQIIVNSWRSKNNNNLVNWKCAHTKWVSVQNAATKIMEMDCLKPHTVVPEKNRSPPLTQCPVVASGWCCAASASAFASLPPPPPSPLPPCLCLSRCLCSSTHASIWAKR